MMRKTARNGELLETHKITAKKFIEAVLVTYDTLEEFTKTEEFNKQIKDAMIKMSILNVDNSNSQEFLDFIRHVKIDSLEKKIYKFFAIAHFKDVIDDDNLDLLRGKIIALYGDILEMTGQDNKRKIFEDALNNIARKIFDDLNDESCAAKQQKVHKQGELKLSKSL